MPEKRQILNAISKIGMVVGTVSGITPYLFPIVFGSWLIFGVLLKISYEPNIKKWILLPIAYTILYWTLLFIFADEIVMVLHGLPNLIDRYLK